MSDSPLPQPPFTPHLIPHTYPPWSLRGPRGSTFVLDKSWVTNHLSPAPTPSSSSLPGDLHGNPLCLAAQGSFLVSLPQLTLASRSLWIPLPTHHRPGLCSLPVCAPEGPCVLRRLSFPSPSQAMCAAPSRRDGEVLNRAGFLKFCSELPRPKDCLVHPGPLDFTPTLQMGIPRPDREEVCPWSHLKPEVELNLGFGTLSLSTPCLSVPHLVNRKQKASENISILGVSEKHV